MGKYRSHIAKVLVSPDSFNNHRKHQSHTQQSHIQQMMFVLVFGTHTDQRQIKPSMANLYFWVCDSDLKDSLFSITL